MHSGPCRFLPIVLAAALFGALLAFAAPASAQIPNHPPIVFAGQDKVILLGLPALQRLDSSGTFDIDGSDADLRYSWEVVTSSYSWLPIIPTGSPAGRTADWITPTPAQAAQYGYSITFRLTVTDTDDGSSSDTVTYSFKEPPSASITVSALLPDPNATDTDGDGTIEDDERYTLGGIRALPGQSGNDQNTWSVQEGARLTLTAAWTPGRGDSPTTNLEYRWLRLSASPPRTEFNIPSRQADDESIIIDLPEGFDEGRLAVVHYKVTITDPDGIQINVVVRINVVDHQSPPTVTLELANVSQPAQDANGLDPDNPTLRYVVEPGRRVSLVATGTDTDGSQARNLDHTWSGTGVVPSGANLPGTTSRAAFTAPSTATHGQSFIVTVTVTDPSNRTAQDQIVFIVADNEAPTAIAPNDFPTKDGSRGGTDGQGTVVVKGIGTDPDGDTLIYRWVQVDDEGVPLEKPTLGLINADTATVSFAAPQFSAGSLNPFYLQLTVIDVWGTSDTDDVIITILGINERPTADAGPNQVVEPGDRVQLDGTNSFDTDLGDRIVSWSWEYTGFASTPTTTERPPTPFDKREMRRFLPDDDGDYPDPLRNENTPGPSFTAPELGGYKSVQLTFTLTITDTSNSSESDTVTISVITAFFSGNVDGPDFCTNLSLGGPRTYAFDSDGDGVADICALPYTRREAVARQKALEQLASLNTAEFQAQVVAACRDLEGDFGDDPNDLQNDVCQTRRVSDPPRPVDPAVANQFFSGVVSGPEFCANLSLGGPRTYPFDNDSDGVADVCALPYTRREAIARQKALETFATPQAVFDNAVALACRNLAAVAFEGDSEADLARDACA